VTAKHIFFASLNWVCYMFEETISRYVVEKEKTLQENKGVRRIFTLKSN
jgi:hypothetical protein